MYVDLVFRLGIRFFILLALQLILNLFLWARPNCTHVMYDYDRGPLSLYNGSIGQYGGLQDPLHFFIRAEV